MKSSMTVDTPRSCQPGRLTVTQIKRTTVGQNLGTQSRSYGGWNILTRRAGRSDLILSKHGLGRSQRSQQNGRYTQR